MTCLVSVAALLWSVVPGGFRQDRTQQRTGEEGQAAGQEWQAGGGAGESEQRKKVSLNISVSNPACPKKHNFMYRLCNSILELT